jgi:hypothetical protein
LPLLYLNHCCIFAHYDYYLQQVLEAESKLIYSMPSFPFTLTQLNQASYPNQMQIKKLGLNFGTNYAGLKGGGVSARKGKGHLLRVTVFEN